ncbi:MAG: hypothetical protein AAF355_11485 [Myxococcota bacterium]
MPTQDSNSGSKESARQPRLLSAATSLGSEHFDAESLGRISVTSSAFNDGVTQRPRPCRVDLEGVRIEPDCVAFSQDGTYLACLSHDNEAFSIRLISLYDGQVGAPVDFPFDPLSDSDPKRILFACGDSCLIVLSRRRV